MCASLSHRTDIRQLSTIGVRATPDHGAVHSARGGRQSRAWRYEEERVMASRIAAGGCSTAGRSIAEGLRRLLSRQIPLIPPNPAHPAESHSIPANPAYRAESHSIPANPAYPTESHSIPANPAREHVVRGGTKNRTLSGVLHRVAVDDAHGRVTLRSVQAAAARPSPSQRPKSARARSTIAALRALFGRRPSSGGNSPKLTFIGWKVPPVPRCPPVM